jgi:hypothetical protein
MWLRKILKAVRWRAPCTTNFFARWREMMRLADHGLGCSVWNHGQQLASVSNPLLTATLMVV